MNPTCEIGCDFMKLSGLFEDKVKWFFYLLSGPNPADLIRKGLEVRNILFFLPIPKVSVRMKLTSYTNYIYRRYSMCLRPLQTVGSERSLLQMWYVAHVMSICQPFEERFVCHPPVGSDDDDEDDAEIVVKLKNPDGYPIILLSNKDEVGVVGLAVSFVAFFMRQRLSLRDRVRPSVRPSVRLPRVLTLSFCFFLFLSLATRPISHRVGRSVRPSHFTFLRFWAVWR